MANETTRALQRAAIHLNDVRGDYDRLMTLASSARFALIGEASHGTHEFYSERAALTKRLISERRFVGVAIEGDWPDAWRVNRYVRGISRQSLKMTMRYAYLSPAFLSGEVSLLDLPPVTPTKGEKTRLRRAGSHVAKASACGLCSGHYLQSGGCPD